MKKRVSIIILVIMVITIIIGIWTYLNIKENKRIDAEAVTLTENLTIEYGKKAKVSNFIQNLNGTLLNDYEIDTENLGKKQISFEYLNIKNKKRKYTFTITTIDVTKPQIFMGSSYTVKKGYEKKLEDVLLSGDDIDDNPKREIIGEYDVNTVGDYKLTYTVTDSSNNKTSRDFVLHVIEETTKPQVKTTPKNTYIEDVIKNYKTEKTQIGIDVSKWQEEIEWQKVKESGVEFAIIRIGYQTEYDGEYVLDPYFVQNIEGAKDVGLPVGIYFYSYAKTVEQATEQAEWVTEQLKEYEIDLPIAFDWESWTSFNTTGMSFNTINKVANTFLETIEKSGYKGMLYGSKTYLTDIWYPTKYDTWLAHYTNKTNYEGDYILWQMCDTGRIDGINNYVDIDIMYKEENNV